MKSNKNVKGMELKATRRFGDNDVEELLATRTLSYIFSRFDFTVLTR